MYCGASELIKSYKINNSLKFNLLKNDNKHDSLCVSNRLITCIGSMNKIELK